MKDFQRRFLALALHCEALQFGRFTLKSGRSSPYFFNAGKFHTGSALAALGECYADALLASGMPFDMLFGPAYKGIPIATATAMALATRRRDTPVAFSRKEVKDHGEGGSLMGAPLAGRVLVVDDVVTAGTATRQALTAIAAAGAQPAGLLIALDRQERGASERSAAAELSAEFDLPVIAVATLADLLEFSAHEPALALHKDALMSYRAHYGSMQ